jgi:hypothetical protein
MTVSDDLDDTEFDKIVGQYRLKLNGLLYPLRAYGQAYYVDGLIPELESLGIQLHLKLSGVDMPYTVNDLHW